MSTALSQHLELYRLIMTEVKERCAVLDAVASEKVNVWPVAAHEMGVLQIRLICELIALGCLAAHGDIPASFSKRLMTTYEPGRIFGELGKLHPNFYPRACSENITQQGGAAGITVLDDHDYLGKDDLIALHGKTGNVLHRGNLKGIGRGFKLDFQKLLESRNKIVDLLRVHLISLHDPNRYVLIIMNDPNTGNVGAAGITMEHTSESWKAEEARRRQPAEKK